jgi:hypothetical protein
LKEEGTIISSGEHNSIHDMVKELKIRCMAISKELSPTAAPPSKCLNNAIHK